MKKLSIFVITISTLLFSIQAKAISWSMFALILFVTGVTAVNVEYPEMLYTDECLTDKNTTLLEKSKNGNFVYEKQEKNPAQTQVKTRNLANSLRLRNFELTANRQ